MKNTKYNQLGFVFLMLLSLVTTSLRSQSVKVFIMAGQSNMQGQGDIEPISTVGSLSHFMANDPNADDFSYIQYDLNEWVQRDDVWYRHKQEDGTVITEELTVGLGASPNQIGPELAFGHLIAEDENSRILIVKTAWGGKSLAVDFRPPSSGGITGFYYNQMLSDIEEAIENIELEFANFEAGGEVEIAGFCWFQGWNDGDELVFAEEYEQNFNNLITDVRNDLELPELPVVVALTGHGGYDLEPEGTWLGNLQHLVLPAQISAIENGGHDHVAYVDTRDFWPDADLSPEEDFGFHWYNNAESFLRIGAGLATEMLSLTGGGLIEEDEEEEPQVTTFCSCGNCGLSYDSSSNSTPYVSVPCLGSVRPNTNEALPASYNFQEYVFPEPDDQGICLGRQNATATIEQTFIAQTHRHAMGDPLLFTIGERPAVFQMAVTGIGLAPDVQIEGFMDGTSLGTLCLDGPAELSETINLTTANFDEYFSVTLPKAWVKIGLELRLRAGDNMMTLTQNDLKIRPYTELNLVQVDMDIMDYNHEPHRTPVYDNFLQELASAIPASVIRFGQFPGEIVMPEFAINNQEDNTVILTTNDLIGESNVNTGMINFQANILIDAMRKSVGDVANTVYFGNTLNLDPGGWGGGGTFVGFEYNDVFIHELGHALSLPHWVEDYRRINPNSEQYSYPFAGEEGEGSGRGTTWSFNQATYQFVSPTCQDSSGVIGTERSDAMQRGYYCAERRASGKGPWDGFGAFSAMAMSNNLLGSTPYWGEIEDRGEVHDFHFRENDGFPIASIVNGERVFTRHPSQPDNNNMENYFKLPGKEEIEKDAYLICGTAHPTNVDANIIYEPIQYKGTIIPVIDPTDPEMFATLQNMTYEDAPEFYGRTRDITLKLTYVDGTTSHVLVPLQTFDREDFFPDENPRSAYFAVSVPGDKLLCNVEMYHRDFVVLNEFDGELGNINDENQNITAENFMDEAVLMSTLDHSCNCPGTPDYIEPGTPCDDGNPLTVNDMEDGFCNCVGELIEPCGFIENGQFQESTVNWWTWGADISTVNGQANIENIDFDDAGMAQGFFSLNQGEAYRISFDAYAEAPRSLDVIIYFEEENDFAFNMGTIDIGTTMENHEYIFTMTEPTTTVGALEFNFRFSTSAVYMDNICFEEYCGGNEEIPYNGLDDDCDPLTLDDDLDQDGFALAEDCDDNNAEINPDQTEIPYNGLDDDCDITTLDDDLDQDGWNLINDCDDTNPNVHPFLTEIPYNGLDDDCNPTTLDDDLDQDGFTFENDCDDTNADINPNATDIPDNGIDEDCDGSDATLIVDADNDGFDNTKDCDDTNAEVNPGQTEIPYNGIDDDCDATTLDDDLDQDGFALADDCDDNNAEINPGQTEIPYNGIDDDCDITTLDDDLDQDGFVLVEDCDDTNAEINPGQTEIPYNGIDDDCDSGTLDDDLDGDGFDLANDCDDENAEINPGQVEISYNGIDEDCDSGTLDDDLDQDGYDLADDCDDENAEINPGQIEISYNGIDEDCDSGTLDDDLDQDGYDLADDCDDTNADVNPGQTEISYNGIDEDCDPTTLDDDLDQDGYALSEDCDDTNAEINPSQTEIPYNGIDDDCDITTLDDDLDQDGYALSEDCDDTNAEINPSQTEIPYNSIDDDCDATTLDDDLDQDGYALAEDCDDNNAEINPGHTEIPYNGVDDDCNPSTLDDDLDQDGYALADDCDDNNPDINPEATDIPDNYIDEDCDGLEATTMFDMDYDGWYTPDDCDDNNADVHPDQTEIPYNGIDDDCDPTTLDDDLDQDGWNLINDCDDTNPNVHPFQVEIPYNGIDDDCSSLTLDDDLDRDGYALADDCDDNNPDINSEATDIPDNGIDEDCSGSDNTLIVDNDNDGYDNTIDCDDNNSCIHPGQTEIPYNGLDDDCDCTTLDDDLDQDGFAVSDDCDDANPEINFGRDEIPYNGIDDDCNPDTKDDDRDRDGFLLAEDCNDMDSSINPDAEDIPNNGIDENCDGSDLLSSSNNILSAMAIKIYPNPTVDFINLEFASEIDYQVNLFNQAGHLMIAESNSKRLGVEAFPEGLYVLEIVDNETGQKILRKIILGK